ncbi:RloB family protein [Pelosinus fermentans]|uniref:RloB-like protein n=1 Tax=Pelosinus fermentans JBW45 TaxID=1192197 RepID=I8U1R0_9FIRM|nr:RloB family protein [Pelosinus fermentans]AJQ30035.1 RloB-like protein [Pelosinus fermentans JBW45]
MAKIVESPRSRNRRQAGFTVLIVCEGEKTERTYLRNYRRRDTGVKIEIPNTSNTDPLNLVRFAALKADELGINKKTGSVWIVFDVDGNSDALIEKARKLAKRKNMEVILSNPSFELWYLIHFGSTSTALLTNTNLVQNLNRYIPGYNKASNYYDDLKSKQKIAIANASILSSFHRGLGRDLYGRVSNPSTHVSKLVQYLNDITGE